MPDVTYSASTRARSISIPAGTRWLIAGGAATVISFLVIAPMALQNLGPTGIPGTALVVIATLYGGMVIVRHSTPRGRLRNTLLALDLVAIVFVATLTVMLVAGRLAL